MDVGGTFTDVVFVDDANDDIHIAKVLTTPNDPSQGILIGIRQVLRRLELGAADVANIIQGTTLVSNAIIERKGAHTGLITTRGFRDVLETRTEKRYDLYDFNAPLPEPLVPRSLRLGVTERLDARGDVVTPLDEADAEAAVRQLIAHGVESIAVCFLHSYGNGTHERAVGRLIERVAPNVSVSLSCDVAPQIREYPRVSTTTANAYVRPLVDRYVRDLETSLRDLGFQRTSYLMVSGAVVTADVARESPVRLVDSGAAAGAIGAAFYGELLGRNRVISLEMGGTTAKFCFVDDGVPAITSDFEVDRVDRSRKGSGLAIVLPATDMVEMGAGGGSIAWIDELGLLRVGPHSAGSSPGPACYALGGRDLTVTDANLLLGYLDSDFFLGGNMVLERAAAEAAADRLATRLELSREATAWGVHRLATENMVNAAREYVADQGRDPRAYSLIAFGGAGPAHAVHFGQQLGCREVIVPFAAGVTSAFGMLTAPFGFDFVRTYLTKLREVDLDRLNELLVGMEHEAIALLRGAGVRADEVVVSRSCEMRYVGQTHEIRVPIPNGRLGPTNLESIAQAYAREYERLYLHPNLPYELECANWRLFACGAKPTVKLGRTRGESVRDGERADRRDAYFPERGGRVSCRVIDRYTLAAGDVVEGPALIEERETTTVIPPGVVARCDASRSLVMAL